MEVEVITMRSAADARSVTPDVGPSYPRPGEAWERWTRIGVAPASVVR
jgi:hypothetical protein